MNKTTTHDEEVYHAARFLGCSDEAAAKWLAECARKNNESEGENE